MQQTRSEHDSIYFPFGLDQRQMTTSRSAEAWKSALEGMTTMHGAFQSLTIMHNVEATRSNRLTEIQVCSKSKSNDANNSISIRVDARDKHTSTSKPRKNQSKPIKSDNWIVLICLLLFSSLAISYGDVCACAQVWQIVQFRDKFAYGKVPIKRLFLYVAILVKNTLWNRCKCSVFLATLELDTFQTGNEERRNRRKRSRMKSDGVVVDDWISAGCTPAALVNSAN